MVASPLESLDEPFFLLGRTLALFENIVAQPLYLKMYEKPRRTLLEMFDIIELYTDNQLIAEVRALIAGINAGLKVYDEVGWNYLIWTINEPVNRMWYQFGYSFQKAGGKCCAENVI